MGGDWAPNTFFPNYRLLRKQFSIIQLALCQAPSPIIHTTHSNARGALFFPRCRKGSARKPGRSKNLEILLLEFFRILAYNSSLRQSITTES